MRAPQTPTKAYAMREFRRFLRLIGFSDSTREDREKVVALIVAMLETARKRGMSEYEMATTYDADALLDVYRETLDRSS
jgi:flagellar motor component MotA